MGKLSRAAWLWLIGSVIVGLALRLIVWHWHKYYPLGGDEREYLAQALTLLREHRYQEMRLMRPPLYGIFLAVCIWLGDALVDRLRLVQVLISSATIFPMWLLTIEIVRITTPPPSFAAHSIPIRHAPAIAAMLCALSYTLQDYATELLTETLFLFGQTTAFWLLMRAATPGMRAVRNAIVAGIVVGLLCLLRSVALPLLPIGMLWLFSVHRAQMMHGERGRVSRHRPVHWWVAAVLYLGCGVMVIFPWTIRNILTYGGVILVDTTGAENLWLDNDPAGREAVKKQLYALGEDRLTRQRMAIQRGLEAICKHPLHVAEKVWGELREFFALEHTDDMRARPVIWVPPAEVWMRLVLGDGMFLLILLAGSAQLLAPSLPGPPRSTNGFMMAWAGYTLLTALIFHVEFRYRLPLLPALLPYAAIAIASQLSGKTGMVAGPTSGWEQWPSRIAPVLILVLTLLHKPYPHLAWQLAQKHYALAQAEWALEQRDPGKAIEAAHRAMHYDPPSVLARVALARSYVMQEQLVEAERILQEAITLLPDHPLPHVLLGDLIRRRVGWHDHPDREAVREAFAYEVATLQDLQQWSWEWHTTPPPRALDIGNGLDLGMIRGFHATDTSASWRWTTDEAWIRLAPPHDPTTLVLVLASGRGEGIPPPRITIAIDHQVFLKKYPLVDSRWRTIRIPLRARGTSTAPLLIRIQSDVFRPRAYDKYSNDGRLLGIMIDRVFLEEGHR